MRHNQGVFLARICRIGWFPKRKRPLPARNRRQSQEIIRSWKLKCRDRTRWILFTSDYWWWEWSKGAIEQSWSMLEFCENGFHTKSWNPVTFAFLATIYICFCFLYIRKSIYKLESVRMSIPTRHYNNTFLFLINFVFQFFLVNKWQHGDSLVLGLFYACLPLVWVKISLFFFFF